PAPRRHVLAHARQAGPAIVRIEHEERIERHEDQRERLVERERPHIALDPAHLNIRSPCAPLGALEHSGRAIEANDVMAFLSDWHRDPAGPTAELEDRPAGAPRESAEPLDVGPTLERRDREVVQSGET